MTIHKFKGEWGQLFEWEGARVRQYNTEEVHGVTETWLVGKAEGAENFAIRYYELEPGTHSRQEQHAHDHGILLLRGAGRVQIADEQFPVATGDVVYIPPNVLHQVLNTGPEPLGFICVIPAKRSKSGQVVWAEEGIKGLEVS